MDCTQSPLQFIIPVRECVTPLIKVVCYYSVRERAIYQ